MPRPGPNFRIQLPGLDEIFHPVPESWLPPELRAQRRRDRAQRLAESPTPEVVQGIQTILTTIDDVQDALVTLSVALRYLAPRIGPLQPWAKAVAAATDLLNLANIFQTAGILGGSSKGSLYRAFAAMPNTYSTRLRRSLNTLRVNPTFGELLQILQTADQFLGVGLQLGPLMGFRTDAAFLALRGGSLELPLTDLLEWAAVAPAIFASNPWIRLAGLAGGFALSALNLPESQSVSIPIPRLIPYPEDIAAGFQTLSAFVPSAQLIGAAEDVLTDTAILDTLSQELSPADHHALTVARFGALSILAPFAFASPDRGFMREKFPNEIRAKWPATMHTIQASLAPLRGIPLEPALPLPGSPSSVTVEELPNRLLRAGAPGALAWIHETPYDPRAIHAAALTQDVLATLALILEPPGSLDPPEWIPEALQAAKQVESGRVPETRPA